LRELTTVIVSSVFAATIETDPEGLFDQQAFQTRQRLVEGFPRGAATGL
jgi:hypothetical protein